VQCVRRGGRIVLVGEGPLHAIAEYAATEVVGRQRSSGSQLPVDPLALDPAGAQATARCIGPYDTVLALSGTCKTPLFREILDQARSRGAKILCLCLGPSMLEGRADVAIDLPEPRPHRVPGLVTMVLHYVAKMCLQDLKADPTMRLTRLDEGPRRTGSGRLATASKASSDRIAVPPSTGENVDTGDALPDMEIGFAPAGPTIASLEAVSAQVTRASAGMVTLDDSGDSEDPGSGSREAEEAEEHLLTAAPHDAAFAAGRQGRVIVFRCKRCREVLLAEPHQSGLRARCPFCERRVKVPRARGRPYRSGGAAMSQSGRQVAFDFTQDSCALTIMPQGGLPIEARIADVAPEGVEATVTTTEAEALHEGMTVRLRLVAPAFLEPLVAVAVLEQKVPDDVNGEEIGSTRLLLPIAAETSRDVRRRLERLSELLSRSGEAG
jgi:phosphoheptose isomerase